jgi:sodium transport system ATP-binding protein
MIRVDNLGKIFKGRKRGEVLALQDVSFRVKEGEIFALLGPNGAGKTTTLRILSTLIRPTSGDAYISQFSVQKHKEDVRKLIGVVSYETGVYERMTPVEIGYYFGRLNDLDDAEIGKNLEYIFHLLRMRDFVDQRTETFSSGMKQKTVIMRALVTNPQVLIFDEPTSGLDLLTAKNVMDYIRLLRENGKTILFSTHILWEAEKLADRIGIIHKGDLVENGSLDVLRQKTGKRDLEEIFFSIVGTKNDLLLAKGAPRSQRV